jgi:large subunit ribosomal protein L35
MGTKQKTHKGAKKRFKVTGSGKIRRKAQNREHIREKKSSARLRRLARGDEVSAVDDSTVRRQLGLKG